jgi:hypothetical protein
MSFDPTELLIREASADRPVGRSTPRSSSPNCAAGEPEPSVTAPRS